MRVGDRLASLVGPLAHPSEIEHCGTVFCVGGGFAIAPIYSIARALHEVGNTVLSIVGVRRVDLLFWEERMQAVSDELVACMDDGSYGREALVIAREYGIPAVLGTGVATKRIQFGQTIRVDGDVGTVTLLDEVLK